MVSTEAELVAALRGEGRATVAAGVPVALTKGLLVWSVEEPNDYCKKNFHCERRPPCGPRAGVGAGAEGRVWAVGAQAWSAPR